MKKILLAIALSVIGWGAPYDTFLLNTQLSLLPKIAMLEKNIARNKAALKILVVYDRGDEHTAASCSRLLTEKFGDRPLSVERLPFDRLEGAGSYHLVYALRGTAAQLSSVSRAFASSRTLTALYEADSLLQSGFLLSVQMERTPVILINAKSLRDNRFSFPDSLFEISRIVK